VDLFDVAESAIAPGSAAALETLGKVAAVPGASGDPGAGGAPVAERPPARDELWVPIVLAVLVGLCIEWALYHRDVVIRGWRALTSRLRRPARGPA
jgi:hypothetical protein